MRSLFRVLFACSLVVGAIRDVAAQDRAGPNIVVILADDMGYGDVHALNPASVIPTPHLDRLAGEGMTFSDGHSPSAVCTPTRYGLLTGRYCWRTRLKKGVLGGYSPPLIDAARPTLATLLARSGYRTAAIGKWHLGMQLSRRSADAKLSQWQGDPGIDFAGKIEHGPTARGFASYFGVCASLDMAPYVFVRDDRFTRLPTLQQAAVKFPHFVRSGPRAEDFVIDEVLDVLTREATSFIRAAAKKPEPFFLYFPMTAPHKPTQPHERFRGRSKRGEYGDFVMQVDWTVGRVLAELDEAGVADDTLVVCTSDNGSYMRLLGPDAKTDHVDDPARQDYRPDHHRPNGSLRGTKADIYEAGHRVPLFVRWPGTVEAGSRCTETVCLTDLYATFAEILGVEVGKEAGEDSASWLGLLRGEDAGRGAPVVHHSVGGMFAIREGRWKLICGNGSGGRAQPRGQPFTKPYQLYDLDADLGETRDLASEHPEIVARLTETLHRIRERGRSVER